MTVGRCAALQSALVAKRIVVAQTHLAILVFHQRQVAEERFERSGSHGPIRSLGFDAQNRSLGEIRLEHLRDPARGEFPSANMQREFALEATGAAHEGTGQAWMKTETVADPRFDLRAG